MRDLREDVVTDINGVDILFGTEAITIASHEVGKISSDFDNSSQELLIKSAQYLLNALGEIRDVDQFGNSLSLAVIHIFQVAGKEDLDLGVDIVYNLHDMKAEGGDL